MYLDAMEFLDEERDGWRAYEALADLPDGDLERPVEGAHGWSGRDLMAHLLAWQGVALDAAKELAVDETSTVFQAMDADWERRGGEAVNEDIARTWGALPM
ncbi:MAG TPA: maleylpyruvate isomerase N-terminal domain-containing protein, partial [Candidatus Limnocylindrales bacterium]|nr:maleylpyruvate isomerase N-terminal domain-containing protein [Candidatus Limnocylindrales bacterium]